MGVMSRLQSGVDESNREHQHRVQEKDQMIERVGALGVVCMPGNVHCSLPPQERSTNKALQEQLRQEKEEVSILQRKLEVGCVLVVCLPATPTVTLLSSLPPPPLHTHTYTHRMWLAVRRIQSKGSRSWSTTGALRSR